MISSGWVRSDDRSVSPVVGGLLVLGIVVMLAAVMLFMVNGLGDDTDPTPQAQLEFAPAAEGSDYELRHLGGDELGDGDGRVVVEGVANETILESRSLTASESVNLTPLEETVSIIYHSDTGESYVLASFDADPLPLSPDKGCEWVDDQTSDGSDDITIDGIVVNCDVVTDGDVTIENGGGVLGEVDGEEVEVTNGDVYGDLHSDDEADLSNAVIEGTVTSPDDVDMSDVEVTESVDVDGDLTADDGSTIEGDASGNEMNLTNAEAGGWVNGTDNVELTDTDVSAGVDADGNLDVDTGSTIDGNAAGQEVLLADAEANGWVNATDSVDVTDADISDGVDADGNVNVDADSTVGDDVSGDEILVDGGTVNGGIDAASSVDLKEGAVTNAVSAEGGVTVDESTVEGAVDTDSDVTASGSSVEGPVEADGETTIKDSTSVTGTVDASADVTVKTSTTVEGDVESTGDVDVDDSTVEGDVAGTGETDVDDATVDGDVYVGDDFSCSSSTIDGEDCDDYSPADEDDY